MIDLTLVNDAIRAVHLLGLALGFGVAIMADFLAARTLFRPLDFDQLDLLRRYHRTVGLGLVLSWTSGLALVWLETGFQIEQFSPKLIAKIGVVTLLTINAYLIGRIGMPMMMYWQGFRFGSLPLAYRMRFAALAGLSVSGWISAVSLGVFRALKPMGWEALSQVLGLIFLLGLAGALTIAVLSPLLNFALGRARD